MRVSRNNVLPVSVFSCRDKNFVVFTTVLQAKTKWVCVFVTLIKPCRYTYWFTWVASIVDKFQKETNTEWFNELFLVLCPSHMFTRTSQVVLVTTNSRKRQVLPKNGQNKTKSLLVWTCCCYNSPGRQRKQQEFSGT